MAPGGVPRRSPCPALHPIILELLGWILDLFTDSGNGELTLDYIVNMTEQSRPFVSTTLEDLCVKKKERNRY